MSEATEKPAAFVEAPSPSKMSAEEINNLFPKDEEPIAAPAAEVKAAPPAATPDQKINERAKDEDLPALVRIAKAKDALRKETETVSPHLSMLKQFSPQEAQRLAQARAARDPVAALAALGFTHSEYNAARAGVKIDPAPAEPPAPGDPKLSALEQEVQQLRAEREGERIAASRQQFLSHTEKMLKEDPKFPHLAGLGEWQSVESVILQHIQETGTPPGETLDESIRLAAEVVEHRLKKEAERWSKVLTGFKKDVPVTIVPPKAPAQPSPGSDVPRTLTNADTTAPAEVRTTPKTQAEILRMIAAGEDMSALDR